MHVARSCSELWRDSQVELIARDHHQPLRDEPHELVCGQPMHVRHAVDLDHASNAGGRQCLGRSRQLGALADPSRSTDQHRVAPRHDPVRDRIAAAGRSNDIHAVAWLDRPVGREQSPVGDWSLCHDYLTSYPGPDRAAMPSPQTSKTSAISALLTEECTRMSPTIDAHATIACRRKAARGHGDIAALRRMGQTKADQSPPARVHPPPDFGIVRPCGSRCSSHSSRSPHVRPPPARPRPRPRRARVPWAHRRPAHPSSPLA